MDASRRTFLPLPRLSSLANPPFLEVMKSKYGDILVLLESLTDDDGCWNAGKDGQSNGKLSTFLQRDIALFIFGACL